MHDYPAKGQTGSCKVETIQHFYVREYNTNDLQISILLLQYLRRGVLSSACQYVSVTCSSGESSDYHFKFNLKQEVLPGPQLTPQCTVNNIKTPPAGERRELHDLYLLTLSAKSKFVSASPSNIDYLVYFLYHKYSM